MCYKAIKNSEIREGRVWRMIKAPEIQHGEVGGMELESVYQARSRQGLFDGRWEVMGMNT